MRHAKPDSFLYSLLLGGLTTLPALSTDTALPAFLQIAETLGTDVARIALVLSFFMAGFAFGPIVVGPLSDHYGRRPILLGGGGLYALACLGCATAGSLHALLAWCFVQGLGASAGRVLSMAIICDVFKGPAAQARLAYVNIIVGVAPMLAPMLGAAILAVAPWRGIYGLLTVGGGAMLAFCWWVYAETAPATARDALSVRTLAASYRRVLTHPRCLGYSLVGALCFGGLFAYISGSPLMLMGVYRLAPGRYTLAFGSTAFAVMIGAFLSGRFGRHGARMLALGLGGMTATAVATALLVQLDRAGLPVLLPLLFACCLCCGMVLPNAAHGAIEPVPEATGTASAVFSCLQMVAGALASALLSVFARQAPHRVLTLLLAAGAGLAALVYFGRLRPRSGPAADPKPEDGRTPANPLTSDSE